MRARRKTDARGTILSGELLESRLACAGLAHDPALQESIRDALLDGVRRIADMGYEGTVAVFGDQALSVLEDADHKTVVAAGIVGDGRVVAAAQSGFAAFGNASVFDTHTLYENVLEWVSHGKGLAARIVTDIALAAEWLESQGYTSVTVRTDWDTALADADALVTNLSTATTARQEAATAFLAAGGGIFAGFNGWAFRYMAVTPPTSGGNAVLRQAGLSWTDDVSWSFDGTVQRGSPAGNAGFAAALMADIETSATEVQWTAIQSIRATFASVPEGDSQLVPIRENVLATASTAITSPAAPVADPGVRVHLQIEAAVLATLPVTQLFAHRTAAEFGAIATSARVSKRLPVRVSSANAAAQWLSTGLYAAPGEVVTVTLPASLVGKGWSLKVGSHTDDVSETHSYSRMPFGVSRDFPITGTSIAVGSVYGGMLYVVKPETTAPASYTIGFSNAVAAPSFVLGQTTDAEWRRLRGLPAPYAELACRRVIITLHADDIRALANPTAVMRYWNDRVAAQDALVGNTRRTAPERINDDLQISVGWMHSGYPVMAYDHNLATMVDSDPGNDWGFFHEFGHNLQSRWWTFAGEVEVTNNILTMRAFDSAAARPNDGWTGMWSPAGRASLMQAFVQNGRQRGEDPGTALVTYAQLRQGFGWRAYSRFFREYRDAALASLPQTDQEIRDQWVTRFSRVTGRNLGPFFQAWGFRPSQAALDAVAGLPEWSLIEAVNPNPTYATGRNMPVTFDPTAGFEDIFGSRFSVTFQANRVGGRLTKLADGGFTFTPSPGFTGLVRLPYAVRNDHGGLAMGVVTIFVGRNP